MNVESPEDIFTADITVSDRLRRINEEKVVELANSIKEIELINPIFVRSIDDGRGVVLVAGAHRLAAVKLLGMEQIRVVFVTGDDIECKLWEIAENLHRAELTKLERAEQIEEWRKLTASKVREFPSPSGGEQPMEAGVRSTARELGVDAKDVRSASKIAGLTEEAKEAAREAGIDDNQSALLKIASYADQDQVEAVAEIVAEKAQQKKSRPYKPVAERDKENSDRREASIVVAHLLIEYLPQDKIPEAIEMLNKAEAFRIANHISIVCTSRRFARK